LQRKQKHLAILLLNSVDLILFLFFFPDSSVVEKQIKEIYDRYSQLVSKVNDRKAELDMMTEEAKKHADALRTLVAFLDKVERQLPRDSAVPQTRDDAEKQLRSVKNVLEDMYDKQPQLDGLKTQVNISLLLFKVC
jgi:DNA repair exonuclease SbcCD ATPase subunit